MSEPLMIALIAVTVNLGGMLVIYSFLAFFLTRLHWHGSGVIPVLLTMIVASLFWIVPTMIGFDYSIVGSGASYSLCFGNWLVSAFATILFCQSAKRSPRALEDTARVDGSPWLGIYWHVVLPLVMRELGLIAVLIVMATALPVWANLTATSGIEFRPFFESVNYNSFSTMLAVSVITSLPVIAISFAAQRIPSAGKTLLR